MSKMFKCDCCGLCCINLNMSEIYSDLDRGDGSCIHFDINSKLCSVYENRPDKCNVDKMYHIYYKSTMTKEEYYKLNYEACRLIKIRENVSKFTEKNELCIGLAYNLVSEEGDYSDEGI